MSNHIPTTAEVPSSAVEIAEAHRLGIPVIYVDRNGRRPLGARPGAAQEREGRNA